MSSLNHILGDITYAVDKGELVEGLYLDYQEAFDKGSHQMMLQGIIASGAGGNI